MEFLPWLSFALGIAARIFVPFLVARYQDSSLSWSWRMVYPQLILAAIVILTLPLLVDDIGAIANTYWQGAWLIGWAAADLGRLVDKGVMAVRNGG